MPSFVTKRTSILLVVEGAGVADILASGKAYSSAFLSLSAGCLYPQLLQYSMLMFCDM